MSSSAQPREPEHPIKWDLEPCGGGGGGGGGGEEEVVVVVVVVVDASEAPPATRSVSRTTSIRAKTGSTHLPHMSRMEAATAVYALTAKKSSLSVGKYVDTRRPGSVWDVRKSPSGGSRLTQWLNIPFTKMNESSPSLTTERMYGRTEIDPTRCLRPSTRFIHTGWSRAFKLAAAIAAGPLPPSP